jgi:hypothetical protein
MESWQTLVVVLYCSEYSRNMNCVQSLVCMVVQVLVQVLCIVPHCTHTIRNVSTFRRRGCRAHPIGRHTCTVYEYFMHSVSFLPGRVLGGVCAHTWYVVATVWHLWVSHSSTGTIHSSRALVGLEYLYRFIVSLFYKYGTLYVVCHRF